MEQQAIIKIAETILRKQFNSNRLGNGTLISDAINNAIANGRMTELEEMINAWVINVCTDEFMNVDEKVGA